tara:strand:+ start:413 stop:622 length:210 start_codon:yes stop_codon:yes gene_type:complete
MKSTTRESEEDEYPRLKINAAKNIIVLFTDHEGGFIVNSLDDNYPLGNICREWHELTFTDYNGTVTLEN